MSNKNMTQKLNYISRLGVATQTTSLHERSTSQSTSRHPTPWCDNALHELSSYSDPNWCCARA